MKIVLPAKTDIKLGDPILVGEGRARFWAAVTNIHGKGPVWQTLEIERAPWYMACYYWMAQPWRQNK